LYITDDNRIRTLSLATLEVRTLAQIPVPSGEFSLHGIWGEGDTLWVNGGGSLWEVSRSTGRYTKALNATSGSDAGSPIKLDAKGIWGSGHDLYVAVWAGSRILKLTPGSVPAAANFSLVDRAGISKITAAADQITLGYATIDQNTGSGTSGMAVFEYKKDGIVISETSVSAAPPIRAGRIFAEVQGAVNTAIAIANPTSEPAVVSFYVTDSAGRQVKSGTVNIGPAQQVSRFLNESPLDIPRPFVGTFTFSSTVSVAVMALRGHLNERSEFLMTTLQVAPIASTATGPRIIPYFDPGLRLPMNIFAAPEWATQIVLINPTDQALAGSAILNADGNVSLESFRYSIPPRSSQVLRPADSKSTGTAFVQVTPDAGGIAPIAQVIFAYRVSGITVAETGVPAVATAQAFRVFTKVNGSIGGPGWRDTRIAIVNPSSSEITVRLEGNDLRGFPTFNRGQLVIPAFGHVAVYAHEILPNLFGENVLRISTDSPNGIAVIALRARSNERLDFLFTATPASPEIADVSTGPIIFPLLVQGGGYTTEFILFNPTQAATGSLRYFSQSGIPLPLTFQ